MNSKFDTKMLKATIIIQNRLKYKNQNIETYNDDILKMKRRIMTVIDRIQNNYDIGLINQDKYNENIQKIDELLSNVDKLPYPLTLKENNYIDLKVKLFEIKQNIVDLVCECGTSDLVNIVSILIKDSNKILSTSSSKYLDFLNDVFIPISSKIIKSAKT